jgi:hypothetical protein
VLFRLWWGGGGGGPPEENRTSRLCQHGVLHHAHLKKTVTIQDITANSKPNIKCCTIRMLQLYAPTTGITAHGSPLYTVHTYTYANPQVFRGLVIDYVTAQSAVVCQDGKVKPRAVKPSERLCHLGPKNGALHGCMIYSYGPLSAHGLAHRSSETGPLNLHLSCST